MSYFNFNYAKLLCNKVLQQVISTFTKRIHSLFTVTKLEKPQRERQNLSCLMLYDTDMEFLTNTTK
jgi:hypothetical protein